MPKPYKFISHIKNIAVTAICLAAASALCLLLKLTVDARGFGAVFLLCTAVISERTEGYFFGIFSAAAGAALSVFLKGSRTAADAAEIAVTLAAGITVSLIIGRSKAASQRAEKEKLRADLLRSAAHDVRTPLTSIKLSAQMLTNRSDRFSQQDRTELLRGIIDSADRLTLMSENILTLTRENLSRKGLSLKTELAEEVISAAALQFRRLHGNVAVITTVPDEPVELGMDAQLIMQVMRNLMENSAGHGEADEIEIALEIKDGFAEFRFSDNGKGIPEGVLENLFGEHLSNSQTDGTRSMGMGLSLCKTITELHGGTLYGRNTDNGAEFTFTLPQ